MYYQSGDDIWVPKLEQAGRIMNPAKEGYYTVEMEDGTIADFQEKELEYAFSPVIRAYYQNIKNAGGSFPPLSTRAKEDGAHPKTEKGIWLHAIPVYEEETLSAVQFYLSNVTDTSFLCTFSVKQGKVLFFTASRLSFSSFQHVLLYTYSIADWKTSVLSFVFHDGNSDRNFEYKLSAKWVFEHMMQQELASVPIFIASDVGEIDIPQEIARTEVVIPPATSSRINQQMVNLYRAKHTESRTKEYRIDLHWENLGVDERSSARLGAEDKKQFQLSYLEKELYQAYHRRIKQVIVIHGIGNGTLKRATHELLQKQTIVQSFSDDFPFHQAWSGGATMVHLK